MNKVLIILGLLLALSCKDEPKIDYAIVSGKVENPTADFIKIRGTDVDAEIKIKDDGTFRDTLNIPKDGFYILDHGREMTHIYLKNGHDLNVDVNTKEFDESLTYAGKGSIENNYLAEKTLRNEQALSNSVEFYSLEEEEFLKRSEEIKRENEKSLDALVDADENFLVTERKNLVYDRYGLLNNYENRHKYYTKNPEYKTSGEFLPEELKTMTFHNETDYHNSQSYKDMAFGKTLDKIFESIGDDYQNANTEDLKIIEEIKIESLKNDVINYLGSFLVSPGNTNMKELHNYFVTNTNDTELKDKLNKKYDRVKDLTKGNPSPQFVKYENHKGGETSLEDLKGKYVYVDVWATWCGPCIREIPSLKEVEKKFHGKNIEFVSTSIDVADKHDAWVAMVNDKDLGGIQLMADNDWNSKFVKDYAIEGIPRFILIDPDGNIVSADAPRPSNPKLTEMLESLL